MIVRIRKFQRSMNKVPNLQRLMRIRNRYKGMYPIPVYRPWGPDSRPKAWSAAVRNFRKRGFLRRKVQIFKSRYYQDTITVEFR